MLYNGRSSCQIYQLMYDIQWFVLTLARNHCFYNGNKRTAFASTDLFLKKNGYKLKKNDNENENFTVSVAAGNIKLADIASWLEENSEKY